MSDYGQIKGHLSQFKPCKSKLKLQMPVMMEGSWEMEPDVSSQPSQKGILIPCFVFWPLSATHQQKAVPFDTSELTLAVHLVLQRELFEVQKSGIERKCDAVLFVSITCAWTCIFLNLHPHFFLQADDLLMNVLLEALEVISLAPLSILLLYCSPASCWILFIRSDNFFW